MAIQNLMLAESLTFSIVKHISVCHTDAVFLLFSSLTAAAYREKFSQVRYSISE